MGEIVANCRSAQERKFSDDSQKDLQEAVSNLIKDETSCETLLSYASNEDESAIYGEVKESRRKLSFLAQKKASRRLGGDCA